MVAISFIICDEPNFITKGIQQWQNQIVTKDEVYISHFNSFFFFTSNLHPFTTDTQALPHTLSSSPSWRSKSSSKSTKLDSANPGFYRWCRPRPRHWCNPITLNPPNHICFSPPLNHLITLELQSLMTRHLNLTSQISKTPSSPTHLRFENKPLRVHKAILQALAGRACCHR